ncbi:MAG: hypothetical protein Q4C45_09760 [Oscillospiraceae bacterium]|nr:hypothetical protein [Oscillospiraceae bacterium]
MISDHTKTEDANERKALLTYVAPATLTNACMFLFTTVDGQL